MAVSAELGRMPIAVDLGRLWLYELRHKVVAETLQATGDLDATQELMGHRDKRTTSRYAVAALPDWLEEAAAGSASPVGAGTGQARR